jgi:predicted tellurium resistance membrane protein TerC
MDWISNPDIWIGLATLTALEIVLGIDNIIFISILASRLPMAQQKRGRNVGLALAMVTRLLLLFSLSWMIQLTEPFFTISGTAISGRDLILLLGGLFLIFKATREIHHKLEGEADAHTAKGHATFAAVIVQIALIDIVFSLDSVITAVGMVDEIGVMVAAVVISVAVMLIAAGPVARFVDAHPTVKMLALSFLLMIGLALIADGLDHKIPKGYIYSAMAFSVFVELLNLKAAKKSNPPVKVRGPKAEDAGADF